MTYKHNQICTLNSDITIGHTYDYSEDWTRLRVEILEDNSDDEFISFRLKIVKGENKGMIFDVSARTGFYAYNGMWRLHDCGCYDLE